MKLEDYKSGEYVKMNDYKAFIPSKINYNWGWDDTKLDKLLAEANRQIGELNAYSLKNIINCLLENNIIVETTGYSRNQIFTFQKYTDLFLK